ncbi:hypothetical protein ACWDYH_17260 [Nocardia goodfellowii]
MPLGEGSKGRPIEPRSCLSQFAEALTLRSFFHRATPRCAGAVGDRQSRPALRRTEPGDRNCGSEHCRGGYRAEHSAAKSGKGFHGEIVFVLSTYRPTRQPAPCSLIALPDSCGDPVSVQPR